MPGRRQSFAEFAALPVGEADDGDLPALRRMQRDGAAGAPDEVGGMGADDERGVWPSVSSVKEEAGEGLPPYSLRFL